jgi:hypothetical protein
MNWGDKSVALTRPDVCDYSPDDFMHLLWSDWAVMAAIPTRINRRLS